MRYDFWQFSVLLGAGLFVAACSASDTPQSVGEPPMPIDVVSTDASKDVVSAQPDALIDAMNEVSPLTDGASDELPQPISNDALLDGKDSDEVEVVADSGPVDLCAGVTCDDGDACTGLESCDPTTGQCVSGEPVQCDDGNPCNGKELCAPATGECIPVDVIECDDSDACNGLETCAPETGECVAGEAVICDDGDACNGVEECVTESGECSPGVAVVCDDGDACNGVESCLSDTGECQSTEPVVCDDGNACTGQETCDVITGDCMQGTAIVCDDGNACNGQEKCINATGACKPGTVVVCDDEDACNGLESCDPKTGECQLGTPVICDDGDGCNGIESCDSVTGLCVTTGTIGQCPVSPDECDENGKLYGPDGDKALEAPDATMLRLRDSGMTADKEQIINSIKAHSSVQSATYGDILADLNRDGEEVDWVLGVECFAKGYKFNSGDNWVEHWWPQGMSGSATGQSIATSSVNGEKIHLISWYHKPDEDGSTDVDKGMRLSLLRTTSLGDVEYRNILMVEPVLSANGTPTLKPVVGHAGGIVWYKNLVYVADTSKGFRVFDMNHLMKVQTGDKDLIGYQVGQDEYHAFNYGYVLPLVNRYKLCESSCCARFSFCSIDMSLSPPRIVAGEYTDGNSNGRIHRWEIDEQSGWLALDPGQDTATADSLFYPNAIRMQGATTYNGVTYVSSSNPKTNWPQTPGTLYVATGGNVPVKRGYPTLPEDLYHNFFTGHLWTVTEFPGLRYVFAVHRSDALLGCN